MPYCSQCGVEIDKHMNKCPLCFAPIQHFEFEPEINRTYPAKAAPESKPPDSMEQPLHSRILIISFLFLLPLVIIVTVDLLFSGKITWSLLPATTLAEVWIISFLILFFHKKPVIYITCVTASVLISLYLIDLLDKQINWFLFPALPITLTAMVIILVLYLAIKRLEERGKNITAIILTGVVIFCLIIDAIIQFFINKKLSLSWSILVFVALFPVVLLLLYLFFNRKKGFSFRKTFHL